MTERVVIRSYHRVFEVDRRVYRIDRWVLPVPGGIPLLGCGYFGLALLLVLLGDGLPLLGDALGLLSPPLRYLLLPVAVAVLGTQATPDGRSPHRFAWDWLTLRARARRRCAGRPVPEEGEQTPWRARLGLRWDADAPTLQRARLRGPLHLTFNRPVQFRGSWRGGVIVKPGDDEYDCPRELDLDEGRGLKVRP